MIFHDTPLADARLIEMERHVDERGFFARCWCQEEARAHGIELQWVQCNVSHNRRRGTLRGMHYQYPQWEAKLVRVTRGSIVDAIADLRPTSPTYMKSFCVRLDAVKRLMLFVPEGFAHGFMTLQDDTEIFYQMSTPYRSEQARGFRYDDPQFAIDWPEGAKVVSDRDRELPNFRPEDLT